MESNDFPVRYFLNTIHTIQKNFVWKFRIGYSRFLPVYIQFLELTTTHSF